MLALSTPQPPAPPSVVFAIGAPGMTATAGKRPLQAFARPFRHDPQKPRVALILSNETDRSPAQMTAALALPGEVTLALTPYTPNLADWAGRARQAGHEVLLGVPMEPADPSIYDPGPLALLAGAEPAVNRERLDRILARASGYVGVLPLGGGRFLATPEKLRPVLVELDRRGLLFVDPADSAAAEGAGALSRVRIDQVIEADSRQELGRRLAELEGAARRGGAALGLVHASPAAVEEIAAWAAGLAERGVALAPVTALLPQ
ncbi:MAG: divergent polysaccharide deacetylase family protein [Rhodospirillales bacterium]|nr:divergent polysaccharide deacetylase family protein [Rhodospirillales bacterium]